MITVVQPLLAVFLLLATQAEGFFSYQTPRTPWVKGKRQAIFRFTGAQVEVPGAWNFRAGLLQAKKVWSMPDARFLARQWLFGDCFLCNPVESRNSLAWWGAAEGTLGGWKIQAEYARVGSAVERFPSSAFRGLQAIRGGARTRLQAQTALAGLQWVISWQKQEGRNARSEWKQRLAGGWGAFRLEAEWTRARKRSTTTRRKLLLRYAEGAFSWELRGEWQRSATARKTYQSQLRYQTRWGTLWAQWNAATGKRRWLLRWQDFQLAGWKWTLEWSKDRSKGKPRGNLKLRTRGALGFLPLEVEWRRERQTSGPRRAWKVRVPLRWQGASPLELQFQKQGAQKNFRLQWSRFRVGAVEGKLRLEERESGSTESVFREGEFWIPAGGMRVRAYLVSRRQAASETAYRELSTGRRKGPWEWQMGVRQYEGSEPRPFTVLRYRLSARAPDWKPPFRDARQFGYEALPAWAKKYQEGITVELHPRDPTTGRRPQVVSWVQPLGKKFYYRSVDLRFPVRGKGTNVRVLARRELLQEFGYRWSRRGFLIYRWIRWRDDQRGSAGVDQFLGVSYEGKWRWALYYAEKASPARRRLGLQVERAAGSDRRILLGVVREGGTKKRWKAFLYGTWAW